MENEKIDKILENWDFGKIIIYNKAENGEVNHNWIIKTSKGDFILRKVTKNKKLRGIKFELEYLKKLKQNGFSYKIPLPLPMKNKKEILNTSEGYFWVYKFIEGEIIDKTGKNELMEMARMMAMYHDILEKINLDNKRGNISAFAKLEVLKELKNFREKAVKKVFLEESEKLIPILESLDEKEYNKLKQYPIHRDLNPENIIWKDRKISGIIDFDNVSELNDTLIKDVSIVIQYCCPNKLKKLEFEKARFFINEYRKYRKLSEEEIKLLPEILTAAFIEDFSFQYWLMNNDSERSKPERLKIYSRTAQWYYKNKAKIIKQLG